MRWDIGRHLPGFHKEKLTSCVPYQFGDNVKKKQSRDGTLLVDGILVSSFASFPHHLAQVSLVLAQVSHLVLAPCFISSDQTI